MKLFRKKGSKSGPSSKKGHSGMTERECGKLEETEAPFSVAAESTAIRDATWRKEVWRCFSPFRTHTCKTKGKQFQNLPYHTSMSSSWKSDPQKANLPWGKKTLLHN